jgi:hypothetical protein
MSFKYLSLTLSMVSASTYPTITIKENGKDRDLYIVNNPWYSAGSDRTIQIPHDGRSYLSHVDAMQADGYYMPNWLGGSLEYDFDLS